MNDRPRFLSLNETQELVPDHDYVSTADNLSAYGRESDEPCFQLESVAVDAIEPGQLIDDPDDDAGWAKVASIRGSIQAGVHLPPVYLRHVAGGEHPYYLFEGRHRYNAAHAEGVAALVAWVAHIDCCVLGGADV